MNDISHSAREASNRQRAEVTNRLDRAFRDFCDAKKCDMRRWSNAGSDCRYTEWLHDTGKARFGSNNTLTRDAVIGAAGRLKQGGVVGLFFHFLHAKEAEIMETLGIPENDPYRRELSTALAEAMALPAQAHWRSRT